MEDQIRNPDECNDFSKNFLRKRNENNSIGQPSTSPLHEAKTINATRESESNKNQIIYDNHS